MRSRKSKRVEIIDETFIDAPPGLVASVVRDRRNQRNWWPHVVLTLVADRGDEGLLWRVSGQLEGEFEVWLEPCWEGTLLHHYVRATAPAGVRRDVGSAHVARWKAAVTSLKDALEPPRSAWTLEGGESIRSGPRPV